MPKPPPLQRRVCAVARDDTATARTLAHEIEDPWHRTQAQAFVLYYATRDLPEIAAEVAASAALGRDAYQQSAAKAWEVAALAHHGLLPEARAALDDALAKASQATPNSSRAEALILLVQAAYYVDEQSFMRVAAEIRACCADDDFWRCQRALKDLDSLCSGKLRPRLFFWEKEKPREPLWYRTLVRKSKDA